MNVRVDFAFGAQNRLVKAAQIVQTLYQRQEQVFVYCADEKRNLAFSKALWAVQDTAFIAHEFVLDTMPAKPLDVVICPQLPLPPTGTDKKFWLLNLDVECPPNYKNYPRILEVVSTHQKDLELARERWRHYKAQGVELHSRLLKE